VTVGSLSLPQAETKVGAITPDGTRLYATMVQGGTGAVMVADTAAMARVTTIQVGNQPFGIAIVSGSAQVGLSATLKLVPTAFTNRIGTVNCVTATLRDGAGKPVPGVSVRFAISGSASTNATVASDGNGQAAFCYQGPLLPGVDVITAFADTYSNGHQDAGELAVTGGVIRVDCGGDFRRETILPYLSPDYRYRWVGKDEVHDFSFSASAAPAPLTVELNGSNALLSWPAAYSSLWDGEGVGRDEGTGGARVKWARPPCLQRGV
jgi:YVTN family beta-propeller protein